MRMLQRATILRLGVAGMLAGAVGVGLHTPAAGIDLGETSFAVAPEPPAEDAAAVAASEEPAGSPQVIPSPGTRTGLWAAGVECLYGPGEPRALSPCSPPPPCHPSHPPVPYDLVGVGGVPTDGPIYRGPCEPRAGTHNSGPFWRLHHLHDRFFDWFYRPK